jgi:hypothetical protein
MGIFLKEMVLDLPGVIDADAVGELDLFQRFAIDACSASASQGRAI